MTSKRSFPPLLETFFTERLLRHQHASSHTVASYRDTFSLLLRFTQQRLHKTPSVLTLDDLELHAQRLSRFPRARTRHQRPQPRMSASRPFTPFSTVPRCVHQAIAA